MTRLFINQRSIESVLLARTRAEGDDVCARVGGNCNAWCGTDPRDLYLVSGYRYNTHLLMFFLFLIFASQRRRRVLQANVPTDWKPTPHVCDQEYSSKLTVRYAAVTAFFCLIPCRSWQQDLEEAQKTFNEYKAKAEEQSNLWKRLGREAKEARVSVTYCFPLGS